MWQHLKAPCCDHGSVVQSTVQILNKKYSLFHEQPAKRARQTKAGGKVSWSLFFVQEAEPQRGECVLRANLLCQWYNQHVSLVYLYMLGGLDAFVIRSVNCTGSQPCICSDLTTSRKATPPPTPTHATPPVTVRKPAKWELKHTSHIWTHIQALVVRPEMNP